MYASTKNTMEKLFFVNISFIVVSRQFFLRLIQNKKLVIWGRKYANHVHYFCKV